MRILALLMATALLCAETVAQDYAREARWKSEVLGNLVVGDAVEIALPREGPGEGRRFLGLYTEGRPGQPAVLLVHGVGVHPDHGVIGVLRVALSDLGYTTLSIQMPVLAADADGSDYGAKLFEEAAARIQAGADWLAGRKPFRLVLLSHSLGSAMSQDYLASARTLPFAAWLSLGRGGAPGAPVTDRLPVLDVHGEKDLPAVLAAAAARRPVIEGRPGSRQVVIPGADHFYTGREAALTEVLRAFLARIE